MPKGVSAILASILIVLVSVALAGTFLTFAQRTATQLTESSEVQQQRLQERLDTRFVIEGVADNQVVLRNTGQNNITQGSLDVFLDDILIEHTMPEDIAPGEIGVVHLNETWKGGTGDAALKVSGLAASDFVVATVTPDDGLVLHLTFDEGTGVYANDSVGNNGALVNASGAKNIVHNPSFEGDDAFYAIQESDQGGTPEVVADSTAPHGSRVAHFKRDVQGSSRYRVQNIPVVAGRLYTFSAWGKTFNVTQGPDQWNNAFVFGRWINSTGHEICCFDLGFGSGTSDWSRKNKTQTAPPDTVAFKYAFGLSQSTGEAWMDGFQFEEPPLTAFEESVWESGAFVSAVRFDGTNDFARIQSHPDLHLSGGETIEAWVKPQNTLHFLFQEAGWSRRMRYTEDNKFVVVVYDTDRDAVKSVTSSSTFPSNEWHHIAYVFNETQDLTLYVNGNYEGSLSVDDELFATNSFWWLGRACSGAGPLVCEQYFNGTIDEVRIYNRALSQSELMRSPDELYKINRA